MGVVPALLFVTPGRFAAAVQSDPEPLQDKTMSRVRASVTFVSSPAAALFALLAALPAGLGAQAVTPASAPSAPAKEERIPVETAQRPAADQAVELSPFTVTADNNGYQASNTMSGTRLNTKIEDLAASISVVTKQQILDTAAVDLNDIFTLEGNTEGIYQYTDFVIDRGFTVDTVAQTPEVANRVRGLGQANLANNGFASSRAIPVDTYNVDSIEIARGPNSNLFGVGEVSGTINLIRGTANLSRDITQTAFRVDDRGSVRASIDLNRHFFDRRVALRVAAVNDETEFVRKPSFDDTRRMTAALAVRPFRNTTLRASYEVYRNSASRANSTTPRDTITEWRANGSPVWDPTFNNNTGGWRPLAGTTYTSMTAAQEATALPRGILNGGTGFWNRPSLYVNPDGSITRYEVARTSTTAFPSGANTNLRYQQIGTAIQRGGGFYGVPLVPLFQQAGVTDQSIYDWEEINFAAPNYLEKKAGILQVQLEQWILRGQKHQLALQAGIMREDIENRSRSFIGASDGAPPVIQVDINEKFLDGTPNPNFLRPYVGGTEMQTFSRPEKNDNARATLAYQLDFTQDQGLSKWLGRHNFAAYGEFRENTFAQNANGLRYRDQVISNETWHTAANLTNLPARGPENRFYTRYYMGDALNAAGSVIDYAGARPSSLYGAQTFRWYNGVAQQWVNDSVDIGELYFALGKQKSQLRSRGLVWQGFLLDNRIVPALGWRRDKSRSVQNLTVPVLANGYFDESFLDRFPENWIESSGPTSTKGVVVRPLKGIAGLENRAARGNRFAEALSNLRLHYNESNSFQPAPAAYNAFGQLLPDPTGEGQDYGFSFDLLDGKITVRFNKYEMFSNASRSGSTAVLATRPLRLDFDTSGDAAGFGVAGGDSFDLEDNAFTWVTSLNPSWTQAQVLTEVYRLINYPQAEVDAIKNRSLADINNVKSKGTEIEVYYNPTRYWTVRANVTQQQAMDTSLSPNIQRYIDKRWTTWTTLRVPTGIVPATGQPLPNAGQLWWDVGAPGATGNNIPKNFYASAVDAPYKLAVTNSGKPRPQTREWRMNLTTNYRFAGLKTDKRWLNNFSAGGSLRWEDEAVVGFIGKSPEADGAIRELDGNRPIMDSSRTYVDLMASYNLKFLDNRVSARLQLNVRNVTESGRLQVVGYNPDGTPWNFRIIDPRQFLLSATFDF